MRRRTGAQRLLCGCAISEGQQQVEHFRADLWRRRPSPHNPVQNLLIWDIQDSFELVEFTHREPSQVSLRKLLQKEVKFPQAAPLGPELQFPASDLDVDRHSGSPISRRPERMSFAFMRASGECLRMRG
jgi:hypothetical protein